MRSGPRQQRGGGRRHFALALVGTILLLDQVSKGWVLTQFTAIPRVIEITSFFNLRLIWNYGISFGLFNYPDKIYYYVFFYISLGIILFLFKISIYVRSQHTKLSLYIIVFGAIGNNLDRLRHHGVVDFIDLHILSVHWPTFNVADLAITIGAVVLMSDSLVFPPRFWSSLRG